MIQRDQASSASGPASSIPASSTSSRSAVVRRPPSPSSAAPPGNTHASGMKRAPGLRRPSSTSSAASPPRSRMTLAASRGRTGSIVPILGWGPMSTETAQLWICESCGFIYDPAEGDPDGGIPPGTAFEDIPSDWYCPVCGARKVDFVPYEA